MLGEVVRVFASFFAPLLAVLSPNSTASRKISTAGCSVRPKTFFILQRSYQSVESPQFKRHCALPVAHIFSFAKRFREYHHESCLSDPFTCRRSYNRLNGIQGSKVRFESRERTRGGVAHNDKHIQKMFIDGLMETTW